MKNKLLMLASALVVQGVSAQDGGIINNSHSPYVKLRNIDMGDCRWTDGFWGDKFRQAETVMIPYMSTLLKGDIGHGYNNLKIAAGLKDGKARGFAFHDGDTYKWMESTMHMYAVDKDPALLAQLDEIIAVIAQAQEPSGYIHTHNQIKGTPHWSNRKYHELYNFGHLITAAVIHHRTTGQTNFLKLAIKAADHLYDTFMPRPKNLERFGFNQTQIMGLVELYRETKDKKYLELAELFINMRGAKDVEMKPDDTVRFNMVGDMVQERTPLREADDAVGHAVLAMYYYAGAADVYSETGEKALIDALNRIWSSANERKMYLTGAVGQTHHGASGREDMVHEAFLGDYMMPNATAYNEVCANIANAMFNWRMLSISGDAKHADIIETVIHNSALSGVSADGTHYFYTNPLRRSHGVSTTVFGQVGTNAANNRQSYLECFCCPPNLMRTLAKLPGWAYSLSDNGVTVNLYGGNELNTHLMDGSVFKLKQETQYPWEGLIQLTIDQAKSEAFDIQLRIPGWAESASLKVNGADAGVEVASGTYAVIKRQWKAGDVITLDLPMKVDFMEGLALIEEVRNQVAIKRGPVVYVAETPDLPKDTGILDVYISSKAKFVPKYQPELLNGLTTLQGELLIRKDQPNKMYEKMTPPVFTPYKTQLIPYYAWSNRAKDTEMSVWLPVIWE